MQFYYIQTFGCQMNEYDSERIAAVLETKGFLAAPDMFSSDIVILNTCSVREKPQHKVESYIGKLGKHQALKDKPVKIGVMGCVAQQEGETFLKRFSCVDFVVGTDNLNLLPSILDNVMEGKRICERSWQEGDFSVSSFDHKTSLSAYVSIMKGCNNFCSYCIVPYVRGPEKSRKAGEIISEINSLTAAGTKEITLLGQNVNSYFDETSHMDFAALLQRVAATGGLKRLRFVTSHPKDFSMELVKVIADHPNICPYVHLPLQSGSDAILSRMNRGYTLEKYYEKIAAAKELIPDIVFSSDFIVGFPGETSKDFQKTYEAVKNIRYESLFAFNYSPRPGTQAEKWEDNIPISVKTARLEALVRLQEEITAEKYRSMTDHIFKVLVEGPSKKDPGTYTGRTVHNRIMNFKTSRQLTTGEEVEVVLTEAKRNSLYGRLK